LYKFSLNFFLDQSSYLLLSIKENDLTTEYLGVVTGGVVSGTLVSETVATGVSLAIISSSLLLNLVANN
jgi:hypothetical protein